MPCAYMHHACMPVKPIGSKVREAVARKTHRHGLEIATVRWRAGAHTSVIVLARLGPSEASAGCPRRIEVVAAPERERCSKLSLWVSLNAVGASNAAHASLSRPETPHRRPTALRWALTVSARRGVLIQLLN